jgi:hypothetical protein
MGGGRRHQPAPRGRQNQVTGTSVSTTNALGLYTLPPGLLQPGVADRHGRICIHDPLSGGVGGRATADWSLRAVPFALGEIVTTAVGGQLPVSWAMRSADRRGQTRGNSAGGEHATSWAWRREVRRTVLANRRAVGMVQRPAPPSTGVGKPTWCGALGVRGGGALVPQRSQSQEIEASRS